MLPAQRTENMLVGVMATPQDKYNIDLATRQIEINEWTYQNKMDTLFVFQVIFIGLAFLAVLFSLKGTSGFSGPLVWYATVIVTVLIAIIIINRAVFTRNRRDGRFWSRRRFQEDRAKSSPLQPGDSSQQDYLDAVRAKFGGDVPDCSRCTG
jgi:hypothetical protein